MSEKLNTVICDRHRYRQETLSTLSVSTSVVQSCCDRNGHVARWKTRLANIPPCLIGMEACVGAHHLSRKLKMLGQADEPKSWFPPLVVFGRRPARWPPLRPPR
jgi:hypothetical protein